MRGAVGRMTAGTAGRIFNFVNSRETKSLTEGCARCGEDEKEDSGHDEKAQAPQCTLTGIAYRRI